MVCTVPPVNHTQLDSGEPTRAFDCGVEKTRDAIGFASCGKVDVDETKLRELMGLPGNQPTNPRNWKAAIESDFVGAKFRAKGLRAPKARLLDGVDIAIARADLDSGRFLVAAGWYGTMNLLAPRKSASRTFGDNHAFGVYGRVRADRTREYDPLADGRPDGAGGFYPEGPQPIKWSILRRIFGDVRIRTRNPHTGAIVAERRLGAGSFLGISVARSLPLVVDPGPVDPPDPDAIDWIAELDDLETSLSDVLAEISAADASSREAKLDALELRAKVAELRSRVAEGS